MAETALHSQRITSEVQGPQNMCPRLTSLCQEVEELGIGNKMAGRLQFSPTATLGGGPSSWLGRSRDVRATHVFEAFMRLHKKFTRFLKGAKVSL